MTKWRRTNITVYYLRPRALIIRKMLLKKNCQIDLFVLIDNLESLRYSSVHKRNFVSIFLIEKRLLFITCEGRILKSRDGEITARDYRGMSASSSKSRRHAQLRHVHNVMPCWSALECAGVKTLPICVKCLDLFCLVWLFPKHKHVSIAQKY